MRARSFSLALCAALAACQSSRTTLPDGRVTGTWGGENAGLIATDSAAHVHIGCELGDADGPITLDANAAFEVTGTFTVGAYPIGPGTTHPALFRGKVSGLRMELTVQLTDTTRQFGPVSVWFGVEPRMGPCPICTTEQAMRRERARAALRGASAPR